MRRMLSVFTVVALVAAMMVSAGPAAAQSNINSGSEGNISNSPAVVQSNGNFSVSFGDDDDDFDFADFGFGFFDDIDDIGDIDSGGISVSV